VPVVLVLLLLAWSASPDLLPHLPWSLEHRALASLGRATSVEVLSIEEGEPLNPDAPPASTATNCHPRSGIAGHRLHGCAVLSAPVDRAEVARELEDWLLDSRALLGDVTACAPQYRHAISWSEGGHRYDVLLCFACSHYTILRDGHVPWWEYRNGEFGAGSGKGLNQFLRAAGTRYFDNKTDRWVEPSEAGAGNASAIRTGT
jgi:hypothetical protein